MNKKKLEGIIKEQRILGHPEFKHEIVKILTFKFNVELEVAKNTVFNSKVEKLIDEDMDWSQHMGPNFWAKKIIVNNLLCE